MNILIGGAWPYANGSLHLGHIAALLPGDILARYYRLTGKNILYVSGSDCHGTPIAIRARQEKVSPKEIADRYHEEFVECFQKLGFSYDLYTRTDQEYHHRLVQQLFLTLLEKGLIYPKTIKQTYCITCEQFLPDRFVEGICPYCFNQARGDQCDNCSAILDPIDLKDKKCSLCGSSPSVRDTEHFYLALSKFQRDLEEYLNSHDDWRENALQLTKRYLREGLQDRAVTRDLTWGIDVPLKGFEGKKIYVWIEAVWGYFTAARRWCELKGVPWETYWRGDVTAFYVHGKDNIPFHTLILPALLKGYDDLHVPDQIISSEYLTIEGRKLSTSSNWAVWVPYILQNYHPDSIRYYLTINGPEKRDSDFSWREFIYSHNGELLGAFGNLVNRSLVFIHKSFEGKVPEGTVNKEIHSQIDVLYRQTGNKIESGEFKGALEQIFQFIRKSNKYFDERQPWVTIKQNPSDCADTIYTCVQIIANLSNLLSPFIPFSSKKIREFLSIPENTWQYTAVSPLQPVNQVEILFQRINKKRIEEEVNKLKGSTV
ncbi:methionine--tRNA ligase [Candidatus Contubernalis alkaliaceticus]|uniref:methionine--tRNA ligase n=1 Tax=Candidatus Contubernalis alkaliaceticus TaxID=338645 RepID=UPI001F4C4211|nr:methionine--tRNA ligase [Candidatus Contubernalis alkalaceticus]UNC92088.1 methionine--tRNA ligase [Candidatus Contubernalis alkalaceticus]